MTEEVGRITKAAGIVGFFTLLSRITGFLRDMIVAYLFGAQGSADAFFVAFRIPNLLRRLTAEGALTAGFIPVFTGYLNNHGQDEAQKVARIIFTFASLVLGILVILGILFSEPLIRVFAPGFAADREKLSLTVWLTQLMFPYIFFVSLVALAMGILNTLRHFMAPALSPVLFNLCIVICALFLAPFLREPVSSLAYGVLIGGVAQLLLQFPYLRRHGISLSIDFSFNHPGLKRLLFLMVPAVFGAAVYQINVLVSTMLASMLPEGSVSYLYYADRLLEFPVGIFAIALGTAALPSFASLVAKKEIAELRYALSYALRLVNFIALPCAIGLMVISVPIFALFFQRGAFDADTTAKTAQALIYYSLGLWGISGAKLVTPMFYAMEDMKTPVWIAFWSFVLNILLSLMLMGEVHASEESQWLSPAIAALANNLGLFSLAHGGLALATAMSSTFNFLVLLAILHRRLGRLFLEEILASFVRNLINALLMGLPLLFIVHNVDWTGPGRNWMMHSAVFLLLLGLGVAVYVILSFLLRSPEWAILRELGTKLKRRSKIGKSV